MIPISILHFIFHTVPIRTPFKDSRKITSLKTFWWLSVSLRVEVKVLSNLPRPRDPAPASSRTVAPNAWPPTCYVQLHRPLCPQRSALSLQAHSRSLGLPLCLECSILNTYIISFTSLTSLLTCNFFSDLPWPRSLN